MAYAAARMAESTLLGLQGEPNMYECAFVQSDVSPVNHWGGGDCVVVGAYWLCVWRQGVLVDVG